MIRRTSQTQLDLSYGIVNKLKSIPFNSGSTSLLVSATLLQQRNVAGDFDLIWWMMMGSRFESFKDWLLVTFIMIVLIETKHTCYTSFSFHLTLVTKQHSHYLQINKEEKYHCNLLTCTSYKVSALALLC